MILAHHERMTVRRARRPFCTLAALSIVCLARSASAAADADGNEPQEPATACDGDCEPERGIAMPAETPEPTRPAPAAPAAPAPAADRWRVSASMSTALVLQKQSVTDTKTTRFERGAAAIGFELGARTDHFYVGGYVFGAFPDSPRQDGLGVSFRVHLRPSTGADPWVGAGFGLVRQYGLSNSEIYAHSASSVLTWEESLQVGLDFKPGRHSRVGPFVAPSASLSGDRANGVLTGPVYALTLGVRATFEP
jgi:hypothetical protein